MTNPISGTWYHRPSVPIQDDSKTVWFCYLPIGEKDGVAVVVDKSPEDTQLIRAQNIAQEFLEKEQWKK